MTQLTPLALQERGFKYASAGIGGCDQWHGMAFWSDDERGVHFRGNISTAKGGTLRIMGQPGLAIDTLEELDLLLSLCK